MRPMRVADFPAAERKIDGDWAESYPRFEEYKRTGEYLAAEVETKAFRDAVSARFLEGWQASNERGTLAMADDGFSVRIDDDLAEGVRAAAAAKGVTVEVFVRDALTLLVSAESEWSDDLDPAIDDRIAEDAIRTGETMPFEAVRPWLRSWGKPGELPPPKWRGSS